MVALDRAPGSESLREGASSVTVSVTPSTNNPDQPTSLAAHEDLGDLWPDCKTGTGDQ